MNAEATKKKAANKMPNLRSVDSTFVDKYTAIKTMIMAIINPVDGIFRAIHIYIIFPF